MDFLILGTLEVRGDEGPIALTAPKLRALLAVLLIHAGEVMSADRLIDALWEEPPRTVSTVLTNLVSDLRGAIGEAPLPRRPSDYLLDVPPESIDAVRFERALAAARTAEPSLRVELLTDALSLWRGEALADFAYADFAANPARRLNELRIDAVELRLESLLELGGGGELVAELEALIAEHPLRERLRAAHMRALYRAGRQSEALDAFHAARSVLVERSGVDPGPELQRAYREILRRELPTADDREADPDELAAVADALRRGRLVVVLGPTTRDETAASVASLLAERFGVPAERAGDLARIGQFVALTQGVGPLYDELHRLHDRDDVAGPLEHALARAVARGDGSGEAPLLVTAAFDEALEQALSGAGVPFDVISYLARGAYEGRFAHRQADGVVRVIERPNTYADIDAGRVVVLKLHGGVDRAVAREWESYAVSEDDHIDYLAQREVASVLPVALAARLRRSHFLFLGYPLQRWSLRVFLHRVFSRERLAYRSWAVVSQTEELERELWAARGVHVVTMPPEAFAEALAERLALDP